MFQKIVSKIPEQYKKKVINLCFTVLQLSFFLFLI